MKHSFRRAHSLRLLAGALLAPAALLPVGALALHPLKPVPRTAVKITASPVTTPQYTIKDLGAIYTSGANEGYSYGSGLNADGITIGYSNTSSTSDAYRWDPLNGILDLGDLALSSAGYENYNTSQAGQFLRSQGLSADPAINDLGTNGISSMVVGTTSGYNTAIGYVYRAFRFDTTNGSLNLGTLGGTRSEAAAVNSAGNVVGYSYNAQSYNRAFLWQPTLDGTGHIVFNADGSYGTMSDLGTLQSTPSSTGTAYAYGINKSGQIAGVAQTDNGYTHAFLYDTKMHDLGTLQTTNPGYGYSYAYGLNDAGQVFGSAYTDSGYSHAYLYDGTMHDLGTLGTRAPYSYAAGISTDGKVCGYSYANDPNTSTNYVQRAFLYDTALHDLGSLGAYSGTTYGSATSQNSNSYAVNSSGQAVGDSYVYPIGQRAFVYTNGFMHELDQLLTGAGSKGWQLYYAYGINDSGQITGYGQNPDGYTHAYLLTPVAASTTPPTPALNPYYTLIPASAEVGKTSDPFTLIVNGTGFTPGSVVEFGGTALTTHPQSSNLLYADVPASLVAAPGTVDVTVKNPDGSVTAAATFTIYTPASVPVVTAVTPDRTQAGSSDTTITVTGTGFDSTAVVGGFPNGYITPASVSADGKSLTLTVPAADLTAAAERGVYILNPAPGRNAGYSDQYSNSVSFYVTGAAPTITSFSPDHATVGASDAFFLEITGTGFNASSRILVNGVDRTNYYYNPANSSYSFVSPTQMQTQIQPFDIVTAGVVKITVTNNPVLPTADGKYPDGGTTEKDLPITSADNPLPTVTELNQHSVTAKQDASITITGTGFVTGTTVKLLDASSSLIDTLTPNTVYSSTSLNVTVPAKDLPAPAALTVEASNPSPGGGDSAPNPPHSTLNVGYATPTVTAIDPLTVIAGGGDLTMTITGTNFAPGATVYFSGTGTTLTPNAADISADGTQIKVLVPASETAHVTSEYIYVTNPAIGGANSYQSAATYPNGYFQVIGPVPTLTSVTPNAAVKGTDQILTLIGTGFGTIYNTVVVFNGYGLTPTTISADGTTITLNVAGAYLAASKATTVYVYNNPGDAAHTTASLPFTIQDAPNPVPAVTSLSSNAVTAGSLGLYLHVFGTGFVPGATVNFNHHARTTQYNSAGDVQTRIDTSELATGAVYTVTVTNPVPGGGESTTSQTFTVGNPVPTLNSLSAYSAPAGSGDLILTLQGTGFVSTSQVQFGTRDTLTVDSASQTQQHLQVTIPAADLSVPGTVSVTVFNPAPAGGSSSGLTFSVTPPAPAITSLSPASATVGDGDTPLVITGTGFYSGSQVTFSGTVLTPATPGGGGTTLTTTIPKSLLTAAGTYSVTVTNGGSASSASFTVNNPSPTFTLNQNSAPVNSPDVALVLTGTGFVSGVSSLHFLQGTTDTRLAFTVFSPTSAAATIPAYLLTAAGSSTVRLINPAPGGGTADKLFVVGTPQRTVKVSLSRNPANQVVATVTLINTGTIDLANVHVLGATLSGSAGTPSATPLGLVPAGTSKTTTITFGSFTGTAGSSAIVKVALAYDGGSIGVTSRLPLP